MESTYLDIEREVMHRRRRLNLLTGIRTGSTWGMTITLIYLATVYVGLLPMAPWGGLAAFNLIAAWVGARRGRQRLAPLHDDLFRVDRAFGLSERLSTIYELRLRSGSTDFLMALYEQTKELPAEASKALPMAKSERQRWMVLSGLTFASVLFLGLWFSGIPRLQISQLFSSSPLSKDVTASHLEPQKTRSEREPGELLEVPSTKDSSIAEERAAAPGDSNPANPSDATCDSQANSSKLAEEQTNTKKCSEVSPGDASAPSVSNSGSLATSQEEAQTLSQALSDLEKRLEQGDISPDELKDQLDQLAKDSSSQGIQDALQHAAETKDLQQLKDTLSKLQEKLEKQGEGSDSSAQANGEEPGAQGSGAMPGSQGDGSQPGGTSSSSDQPSDGTSAQDDKNSDAQSSAGEGESSSAPSGDSSGSAPSSQSSSNSQGSTAENSDAQSNQAQSGGDAAGHDPGQGTLSSSGSQPLPLNQNLLIHGANLPRDPTLLDKLLTRGVPVDFASPERDGMPILRLNLERVEALLELRDLPPDLRNLVRSYFLAITRDR